MSEGLRQATSAIFIASALVYALVSLLDETSLQSFASEKPLFLLSFGFGGFLWFCVLLFAGIRAWDRRNASGTCRLQRVKLIGKPLSAEQLTTRLAQYEAADVKNLSIERCDILALPPKLAQFHSLSSLNLRGNCLTSLEPLCLLLSLRSLNVSQNRLRRLPIDLVSLRRLRYLNTLDNPLPDTFLGVTESLTETQQLLQTGREFFSRAPRCQDAVLALMMIQKRAEGIWASLPRDVVLIIARILHESRHDSAWNCNKLSSFFFRKNRIA